MLRLKGPDQSSGSRILARRPIPSLPGGGSHTLESELLIPGETVPNDYTLVACRARIGKPNRCGRHRPSTDLEVLAPAALVIAPSGHDFGTHATGTSAPAQTFTVTNAGGVPSGVPSVSVGGTDAAQFPLSANTCTAALAPGASCSFEVGLSPASNGAKSAAVAVAALPGGPATATLSGTGAAPAKLTIAPTNHDFGTHATGTTSPAQTFTVTNTGGVPSGTISTRLKDAEPDQFSKSADNCDGHTLAPGASCTVDAAFAPAAVVGTHDATIEAAATPGGTATAALSGTVAPAQLTIAPTSRNFGTVLLGSTSSPTTFTVTNTGGVPSGNITTALGGANSDQFTKSADNCNTVSLNAGASCTLGVAFSPLSSATSGAKNATVSASATPGGTASATLTGNAQKPAELQISPASHDFGNVVQGGSARQTFTITNVGEQTAGVDSITVTGPDGPQFNLGTYTCSSGTSGLITGGGNCTIELIWLPPDGPGSTPGPLDARFDVHSVVPGGTVSATLSGTAITPANLTLTPSSHAFGNVLNGTTATKTFTIKNTGEQTSGIPSVDVPGGSPELDLQSTTCSAPLSFNQTCQAVVSFSPTSAVSSTDNLRVSASPGATVPIIANLSGKGAATAASVQGRLENPSGVFTSYQATPSVDIGSVGGGAGESVWVWLKNSGEADAPISPNPVAINLSGNVLVKVPTASCSVATSPDVTFQLNFGKPTGFDTVVIPGSPAAGSECYIEFELRPTGPGSFSVQFTVATSPGGSVSYAINGTGV